MAYQIQMNNKIRKEDIICGWESEGRTQLPLLKSYLSKGINLITNKFDGSNKSQIPIVLPRRKEPKSKFALIEGSFNPFQLKRKNFEQNYFQLTPKYKKNVDCIALPSLPKMNSQRTEDSQRQQQKLKRQQSNKRSERSFIKYNMSNEDIAPYKLYRKVLQNQGQNINEGQQTKTIFDKNEINRKVSKVKLKLSTIEITHKQVLQKSRRQSQKYTKASTIQHQLQGQVNYHKRSQSNVNVHKMVNYIGKSSEIIPKQCPQTEEVFDDKQLFGSKSQKNHFESDHHHQQLKSSIDLKVGSKRKIIYNNIY